MSLDLETGAKHQLRIHLSKVLNGESFCPFLRRSSCRITCDPRECSTQRVTTAPVLGDPLHSNNHHLSHLPGIVVQRGLYLHASHVSFHVNSSIPRGSKHLTRITTTPFSYYHPPSDSHGSRPQSSSMLNRSSHTFYFPTELSP